MDLSIEIVSQNLATTSNFVGFRGDRNFTCFGTKRTSVSVTRGSGLLDLHNAG